MIMFVFIRAVHHLIRIHHLVARYAVHVQSKPCAARLFKRVAKHLLVVIVDAAIQERLAAKIMLLDLVVVQRELPVILFLDVCENLLFGAGTWTFNSLKPGDVIAVVAK
jgi:hypothetical protein